MRRLAFSALAAVTLTVGTVPTLASAAPMLAHGRHVGQVECGQSCRSLNWSGYAVTHHHFSSVTGSWVVPAVDCSKGGRQFTSNWVGLNGWNNGNVEQTGTDGKCVQGKASYVAWWEIFPLPSVGRFAVKPGDQINASVTYDNSTGTYTVKLVDKTRHRAIKHEYTHPAYAPNTSAEWIVERPALCTDPQCNGFKITKLAKYGTSTFTNAMADGQPISNWTWHATTMDDSKGENLSVPGALSSTGTSFTMTWENYGTISKFA